MHARAQHAPVGVGPAPVQDDGLLALLNHHDAAHAEQHGRSEDNQRHERAAEQLVEPRRGDFEAELVVQGVGDAAADAPGIGEEVHQAAVEARVVHPPGHARAVQVEHEVQHEFDGQHQLDARQDEGDDAVDLHVPVVSAQQGPGCPRGAQHAHQQVAARRPQQVPLVGPPHSGRVAAEQEPREGDQNGEEGRFRAVDHAQGLDGDQPAYEQHADRAVEACPQQREDGHHPPVHPRHAVGGGRDLHVAFALEDRPPVALGGDLLHLDGFLVGQLAAVAQHGHHQPARHAAAHQPHARHRRQRIRPQPQHHHDGCEHRLRYRADDRYVLSSVLRDHSVSFFIRPERRAACPARPRTLQFAAKNPTRPAEPA